MERSQEHEIEGSGKTAQIKWALGHEFYEHIV